MVTRLLVMVTRPARHGDEHGGSMGCFGLRPRGVFRLDPTPIAIHANSRLSLDLRYRSRRLPAAAALRRAGAGLAYADGQGARRVRARGWTLPVPANSRASRFGSCPRCGWTTSSRTEARPARRGPRSRRLPAAAALRRAGAGLAYADGQGARRVRARGWTLPVPANSTASRFGSCPR